MYILTETISAGDVVFQKNSEKSFIFSFFLILIATFYSSSEPISLHLLCCDGLAVDDYSCARHASQLQRPRLVNNPG